MNNVLFVASSLFCTMQDCNMQFQGGSFFVHEGMPYCEIHYHAKRGSLCAGCHKPITGNELMLSAPPLDIYRNLSVTWACLNFPFILSGRCITAMFRKFHPEHFVCSYCLKQLKKGTFKEQADKPYCHGCFDRLFGWSTPNHNDIQTRFFSKENWRIILLFSNPPE